MHHVENFEFKFSLVPTLTQLCTDIAVIIALIFIHPFLSKLSSIFLMFFTEYSIDSIFIEIEKIDEKPHKLALIFINL